jgi:hypothetical protein
LLLSWYNPSDDPEHTSAARIRALGYEVGGETSVPDRPGRSDGTASAWINKPSRAHASLSRTEYG